jgi:hypothetical protein
MGLLSDAGSMARGRAGAVFLTAALALVPAYLVGGAIVFLAGAQASAQRTGVTRGEAFAEHGGSLPPDATADQRRDRLLQAREPGAPRPRSASVALAAGLAIGALAVMAGLLFAQAALLAVAVGASRPSAAWAAVGARFGALWATAAAALAIVAAGLAACLLPGLFAAFAFSFAAAVAMAEGVSGFQALHRSWELFKRVWPAQVALVAGAAALVVLLTQALGRLLPGSVLAHALLDAVVGALILPLPVFASAVLYLRARSAAEGKPIEELRQYILRSSAPG